MRRPISSRARASEPRAPGLRKARRAYGSKGLPCHVETDELELESGVVEVVNLSATAESGEIVTFALTSPAVRKLRRALRDATRGRGEGAHYDADETVVLDACVLVSGPRKAAS